MLCVFGYIRVVSLWFIEVKVFDVIGGNYKIYFKVKIMSVVFFISKYL